MAASSSEGRVATGRCLGCRHPSGSTCGGCGAFVDDGWNGKTSGRETTRHMCGRCGYWTTERECPTCGEVYAGPGRETTVGNDGLTDAERAESAARWAAGVGKPMTRDEVAALRATAGREPLVVQST